ncbi:hypothetical protein GGX14DRAFT_565512 [Mycena pura]|uniref:Uncharacterized protein n=1 Tax=Mycena pura TaxID=153505 RepID=A0AAD6YHW9_9AGAR|nr:hypothetical protein GGX14DRAFT_565512 [Mycena pura]
MSLTVIERMRLRKERERDSQTRLTTPGPDNYSIRSSSPTATDLSDQREPLDLPSPFALMPPRRSTSHNTPAEMAIMKSTGERALKARKLNESAQADFRRFTETANPLERDVLNHLALLEVRGLLQDHAEQGQQTWEPTKELTKIMKKIIRAFLTAPNLRYYGGSLAATIVDAMRKSDIPNLPDDDALIQEKLSHPISVDKNTIKSTIKMSMDAKNIEERNIAWVTFKIMKSLGIAGDPTLALYWRIAHIRSELAKNHPNEMFWDRVDQTLDDYHKEGAAEFVLCLEENFKDDIAKYGDPATTDYKLAANALPDKAPKWMRSAHDLASKVRRVDAAFKSRKRKRVYYNNNEEEGEEENGGGSNEGRSDEGGSVNSGGVDDEGENNDLVLA